MKIDYDLRYQAVLVEARRCLQQSKSYLATRDVDLLDAAAPSNSRCPHSSIIASRSGGKDRFKLGMPFVAAQIEDQRASGEERNERYFDPYYFMVMSIMELAGGTFYFGRSKYGKYWFLVYNGPDGKTGEHSLRRLIANTPPLSDTRKALVLEDDHYDYRRATLAWTAKRAVRKLGQKTRSHARGREEAIAFAIELFKQQLAYYRGSRLPGLELSLEEYELLLREALSVADAIHEALNEDKRLTDFLPEAAE